MFSGVFVMTKENIERIIHKVLCFYEKNFGKLNINCYHQKNILNKIRD